MAMNMVIVLTTFVKGLYAIQIGKPKINYKFTLNYLQNFKTFVDLNLTTV